MRGTQEEDAETVKRSQRGHERRNTPRPRGRKEKAEEGLWRGEKGE